MVAGSRAGLVVGLALLGLSAGCARSDLGVPEQLYACLAIDPDGPTRQVVSADVLLDRSDILFLIDNSNSMVDEIERIRAQLAGVLVPQIAAQVHDAQFGVAVFADFGGRRLGSVGHPYQLLQPITSDIGRVLSAVNRIELEHGGDAEESQLEALYQVATGAGLGEYVKPGPNCTGGGRGGVCFRPEAFAITMLFTDAPMRNVIGIRPDGSLSPVVPAAPSNEGPILHENLIRGYEETIEALQAENIRVLGLWSGMTDDGIDDLRRVARDTGALDESGRPIVLEIGPKGEGLDTEVVRSLSLLTSGARLDVRLDLEDVNVHDAVDARALVAEVRAARADPADGAASDGAHFVQVRSGTRVFFELVLDPTAVPRIELEQRYPLGLRVLTGDGTLLSEQIVDVVIAAEASCEAAVR
jgi:hypothetical protein